MAVTPSEATLIVQDSKLTRAINVGLIDGGSSTSPLWTSQVSNEDFAEALRRSLRSHAMFGTEGNAFRLEATLVGLRQPLVGFNMEVTSTVRYRLVRLSDNVTVFDETVTRPYTAKFGDAFAGYVRLKLANEGSVRENIQTFLALLVARDKADPNAFGVPMAQLIEELRSKLLPA